MEAVDSKEKDMKQMDSQKSVGFQELKMREMHFFKRKT